MFVSVLAYKLVFTLSRWWVFVCPSLNDVRAPPNFKRLFQLSFGEPMRLNYDRTPIAETALLPPPDEMPHNLQQTHVTGRGSATMINSGMCACH